MKINLTAKLILNYLLLILLVFSFTTIIILHKLSRESKLQLEDEMVTRAQLISEFIPAELIKQENPKLIQPLVLKIKQKTNARVTIIAKDGIVLGDSESNPETMENHATRPEVIEALTGKIGYSTRYSFTVLKPMLYTAIPAKTGTGEIAGVIRVALPTSLVKYLTVNTLTNLWFGLLLALALTVILGYISAYIVTKPIREINKIMQGAIQGDLNQKIPVFTKDEIGNLARSLNQLFQQLQGNITEVKREQNKLTAIISSMTEGVIACDIDGRILLVNKTIENMFSVSGEAVQGKMLLEAIRNNDLDRILNEVLKSGQPQQSELTLLLPVQKTFLIYASPLTSEEKAFGAVLVMPDITEIRRLENIRKEFISNVSHELRTPLTSIRGFVETLLNGALEDKDNNRRFLNIIHDHAQRLGKLIDDILELSKIESQEIKPNLQPVDLHELIIETLESFSPQLQKAKLSLHRQIPSVLPKIKADRDQLRQVLINLLDNAIKFNQEKGSVTISAAALPGFVKIQVNDTGQGIPAKDLPRIFERFYRVDKARSRELGGTGLGLAIVKHIIEAHQGQVGVESTEEKGSTFWFILPL